MKYGQKFKFLSDMHLSTPVIPKNSIKSRDSLFRESFRKQAIYHGVADDCVIDKDTFAEISCITGCFKSGDSWIVYDTDERSQVYGEKKYSDLILAYTDIANRLGFSFQVPRIESTRTRTYSSIDAFSLICKSASVKFDETVELHVRLGVDSRRPDQLVRGSVILPHGTGKSPRVLVFATGNNVQVARAAGADYVGGIDLANRILKENWFDFDVVIASPDMMGTVNRLGKFLGPKGLMPSPKAGTVTTDLSKAIKGIKASKIEYRLDKLNMIHCPIGKVSFGSTKLNDNFDTMIASIIKAKPASIKGQYIRSCVTTASSMGPRIRISLEGLN